MTPKEKFENWDPYDLGKITFLKGPRIIAMIWYSKFIDWTLQHEPLNSVFILGPLFFSTFLLIIALAISIWTAIVCLG